jgi:clan AA aspartic protease (TIGR02281 family)
MSIRGAFIANFIALVFGIAWIGEASAQSSILPCPPIGYAWNGCIGTYTWRSGTKYVGEWRGNKLDGKGTYTWPDGQKYVGEFRDGKQNGQGTVTLPDGRKYVGEFRNDELNGRGTFTWPSGRKYVGEFRDGKQNGQGTKTFPDGEEYVGYWRDGLRDGQGTLTLSSGAKYIGAWQAGKKHGQGKEYSNNGELVHEGYWISDEYYGPKPPDGLRVENGDRVKMVENGGIYHVPVVINDALKLDFIVDSGASDVAIPADVVGTLIRTGTVKKSDFIGTETYRLADGSAVSSRTFIIRSLKVGDRTVTDVRASIADVNGPLLLGQSFLKRFKSWSQENAAHELVLQ